MTIKVTCTNMQTLSFNKQCRVSVQLLVLPTLLKAKVWKSHPYQFRFVVSQP